MSSLSAELAALGPLFAVVETLVIQTPSASEVTLCLPDPRRWKLLIDAPVLGSQTFAISTVSGNVAKGGGIVLALAGGTTGGARHSFEENFRDDATIVQAGFYGGISGGAAPPANVTWTVIEVLLNTG